VLLAGRIDGPDGLVNDLGADAVPADDCDAMLGHEARYPW
jgi:hypothetical protein